MTPSEAALLAAENYTPGGRRRLHPEILGLSPADVKAGRRIWRIRQQRAANRPLMRDGVVVHPEHKPLHLPGPCKAYRQIAVRSGWGGRRVTD